MYEKCIDKIWTEEMSEELIINHNFLLWEEAGMVALLFSHLRNCLGNNEKILLVPEHSPTVPFNAMKECKCREHHKRLERYRDKEKGVGKIDLCIVEFEEDLSKIDVKNGRYRGCSLWCFGPKPVVALEVKYTWCNEVINTIQGDIDKLKKMIESRTDLAYLCIITDVESIDDCEYLVEKIKERIGDFNSKDRFRIALGSWEREDLWKVMRV